ncbi:MAG: protochlorophyllide reductase iron-sulfur ATP-binding protein [Candidatus Methanofastidiosum methylothiophilum]|jgi:nitrogenase iron protein NifH|uniref:Protochlorophyllide reductase iron-sulfur ATP-binding protein n=1 Tax=Candidatus Methanofastidiosum methylothiophilum TaxID=1705564 RepID=A0A150JMK3_9EURY|nr:MAG: protochlorophyllide reductase iron-sulfur ATP-binding protein [Candidatus Methanofastidiosum methylthiophilus]OQC52270.1 MAG: protochlorophyllide reductase iron-sulfur ATP-binding protein [Euryarchaeota archaeon ADurb.Bin023]HNV93619.1 nitrogenase iron protein NifH [Methanofastidiosum sp.]KYC57611.1 MAG: protochlorophyllide reductase iron-sulfur ATP-binding protein [Candidatus Methanofastidiosum methylthiophilus]KYC58500.1 MAG: protochlorophyllide reductase iron-sulfur ATP-binding prote
MKQIAIYGKGGIGKSSISSNLSVNLASNGLEVLLVGCDPKSDSTINLFGGKRIDTALDLYKKGITDPDKLVFEGYNGVKAVEVGGPAAGVGCAGRGILVALKTLNKDYYLEKGFDVVIYDVPGDVVCGGFAGPAREGYADEIYIVTSGEYLSIYAANNIVKGLFNLNVKLGGIIGNMRGIAKEEEKIESYAKEIDSGLMGAIERNPKIHESEIEGKTVLERYPNDPLNLKFKSIGSKILQNKKAKVPTPTIDEKIRSILGGFY